MSEGPSDDATRRLTVGEDMHGDRLDAVLARTFSDVSRSRAKELVHQGLVTLDGATIGEAKTRVKHGQRIAFSLPDTVDLALEPEDIPLSVIFEDPHVIVIDKPAGLVVHPAPGTPSGTLVNALLHHCGPELTGIGGVRRPEIVHRLDKDTSGVMVVAKTEVALNALAVQFADHGRTGPLERRYVAFTWGHVQNASGVIDAPLGRDANNRLKQAVRPDGRRAVTRYDVEARFAGEGWDVSRLACRLETGRTHQIRVHMAHFGHPILGDATYASGFATKARRLPDVAREAIESLGRQALHAAELGFAHPETGEIMQFSAPLPPDLQAVEESLAPYRKR